MPKKIARIKDCSECHQPYTKDENHFHQQCPKCKERADRVKEFLK